VYSVEALGPVTVGRGTVQALAVRMRVFVYAVDGLLIDTGPRRLGKTFPALLGRMPPVQQVVLTHLHEDHSGMAAFVAERLGVPIYCRDTTGMAAGQAVRLPLYRHLFWGTPAPFAARALAGTVETGRYTFTVIPTPGHAGDHVALYEPNEGWLFSGDLFLGTRLGPVMRQESMPVLMDSLRRVLALPFDTLFCSHAGPVPDGRASLKRKLQVLSDIQGQVRELAGRGWSIDQVTRHLFPSKPAITWLSLGEFSFANIVRSFWPEPKA